MDTNKNPSSNQAPLRSSLRDDADMQELIEMFVDEMPGRVEKMRAAMAQQAWRDVQGEAHKLRGSAAGHGFAPIGDASAKVEDLLRSCAGQEQAAMESIREQVAALMQLCSSAVSR